MDQQIITRESELDISSHGKIFITVENADGTVAVMAVKNKVLLAGRTALAQSLANQFGGQYQFYIARVLFGSNGTVGGAPRFVSDSQEGLFGPVMLAKPVIATIDPNIPTRVVFTTTVSFSEMVGGVINEMALEMANGNVFSLATFGDINKTGTMQLVWNWRLNWV
jgi:hypothetical protein